MNNISTYAYKVGGALSATSKCYIERRTDIELLESLLKGDYSNVLCPRQTGKSSLQIRTMSKLNDLGYSCAVLDLTAIVSKNTTEDQFYASIIKMIADSFNISFSVGAWWEEHKYISSLQKLSLFIDTVLLKKTSSRLFIFIEEVDSVLSLQFPFDDFFAFIRSCYNKRSYNKDYERITFSVLGVANPSDLISDKDRTPFNIGTQFELNGFSYEEALPLCEGLSARFKNPEAILKRVIFYTSGQPFLTQKILDLLIKSDINDIDIKNVSIIDDFIDNKIINNWSINDNPEHFGTIQDRILRNINNTPRLLSLYEEVLKNKSVIPKEDIDHIDLLLSGIVIKSEGKINIANRIYERIFNKEWLFSLSEKLRPYSKQMESWYLSDCSDTSRLITGSALQEALDWAKGKHLAHRDYFYLSESQIYDKKLALIEADRISNSKAQELLEDVTNFLDKINPKYDSDTINKNSIWDELLNILSRIVNKFQFKLSICYLSDINDYASYNVLVFYPSNANISNTIHFNNADDVNSFINSKKGIKLPTTNAHAKWLNNYVNKIFATASGYLYAFDILPYNVVLIGFGINESADLSKFEKTILDISIDRISGFIRNILFKEEQRNLLAMYGHQINRDIAYIAAGLNALETYGYSINEIEDTGKDVSLEKLISLSKKSIKRGAANLRLVSENFGNLIASQSLISDNDILLTHKFKLVDILSLLDETVEFYKPYYINENKEIIISTELNECKIRTDKKYLQLIFWNIIDNAIKYSYDNKHISIKVDQDADFFIISFTNFGIGVAKDEYKLVFKEFYRSRHILHKAVSGQGMGLYAVKRSMDFLFPKGSIEIKSFPDNSVNNDKFDSSNHFTQVILKLPKR